MEHAEVLRKLEREIELHGSLRRYATFLRVSPQYLSAVLLEQRAIGPRLLKPLKLRRTVKKIVTYTEASRRG